MVDRSWLAKGCGTLRSLQRLTSCFSFHLPGFWPVRFWGLLKTLVIIIALLLPLPLWAGAAGFHVPDPFVGYWAGSLDSCGSDTDNLRLYIDRHHISYWESEGPIKAVVVRGNNEIALIAELSGEGETWLATARFELSPDGKRLIDSTSVTGEDVVRHKCSRSE